MRIRGSDTVLRRKNISPENAEMLVSGMQLPPPRLKNGQKIKDFNLIEAAIMLGVAGLVIGGIWAAANAVSENYKIAETVKGIQTASRNMQLALTRGTITSSVGDMSTFSLVPFAQAINAFPGDWNHNGTIKPPIGQLAGIIGAWFGTSGPRFSFIINRIPVSACIRLSS